MSESLMETVQVVVVIKCRIILLVNSKTNATAKNNGNNNNRTNKL